MLQPGVRPSLFNQSGRVIALGRVMLAALFLFSIWLDRSDPAASGRIYTIFIPYLVFAVGIAASTWRDWWLDARLAAPTLLIDMGVFTWIVFGGNGSTSPFFLFFVLPLLSAAIRWGWRETAFTATALVLLHIAAGLLISGTQEFELQRFIIRSGHLVILSTLLIWFGIHQRLTRLTFRGEEAEVPLAESGEALTPALALAMQATDASGGALVLRSAPDSPYVGVRAKESETAETQLKAGLAKNANASALLFDVSKNRMLTTEPNRHFRFERAADCLDVEALAAMGIEQGLIARVQTGTRDGWLVLGWIDNLSTDYIDLAREVARAVGIFLNRQELLTAIGKNSAAHTRLSLARDVHDSIVQFLAGTAFRVEAIMRRSPPDEQIIRDLKELKRLLLEEQGELRGFISALRRDRELELAEAIEELRALAARLSQQWSISCRVESSDKQASIPIRLQLDLQQLLREAVANAVRHGGADHINVGIRVDDDQLRMRVSDNGTGFVPANGSNIQPWSLHERIEQANGTLMLYSEPGCTRVDITLPLPRAAR